jgi:hypothetical protein
MADWWDGRPWRLIQTNLREIDMRHIDARRFAADLADFRATVVMINAAGIIASYPTQLPFHFRSPYLTGDSLQDILAACHAADIRVIARTDFSKVRRPIFEQHPQWAYRTAAGDVVDYNGDVHVCISGDYQQRYALEIMAELLTTHDFDGIFFNMGGFQTRDYSGNYYGPCHCDACRRAFREAAGLGLPAAEDMADAVYRRYCAWKAQVIADHHRKVYQFLTDLRPELCIANHREFRRGFIRQESNTAIGRPLPHWQYSASDNTKRAVSSYPEMISSNTTVDFIDFPYRHVAVSPHQQKLRLAQGLANGGSLDYYLIGRLDNHEDRSGFSAVREMFHYHAANTEAYAHLRSKANVALFSGSGTEYRGWFRILAENHFLFDSLRAEAAMDVPWERYDAIVLPELAAMSDALAERLDGFVAAGGTLIAAGRTGLRDEHHEPRDAPALTCLGIERVLRVRTDTRSTYLKFDDKQGFARFGETDLLYLDGPYVCAEYAADAQQRLKLIPPHNFGPPERCYYEQVTDHPALVVRRFGEGRAVYIPWLPGGLFHRQGHTNTSDFAADVLAGVAGIARVGGNLRPMVEVTLHEQAGTGALLLHLVNASGHFGNSFFGPVTMTDLEVVAPCGRRPAGARSLVHGRSCPFTWDEGLLTVKVPKLELFDAIVIEPTQ